MSRITDLSAVAISAWHCTESDCKKCRARFRAARRTSLSAARSAAAGSGAALEVVRYHHSRGDRRLKGF